MEQVTSAWFALSMQRRIVVVGATLAMFAAVLLLARVATAPRMTLLYAGLEPSAAGEVIASLEAQGAAFDIRGNAIYVDATQRDSLRMTLAGEGLPSNGGQGYELLDSLSGFGTTSQMFDAAYWRAKEGELARTITTNRQITAARVHLSNPTNDPFSRGEVGSASVTVTTSGGSLTPPQATALRHLVASAVTGLSAGDVAIIDSRTGLVPYADGPDGFSGPSAETRAEALRHNVIRLLEARVGTGKAIVEVNVETVTEREAITERRLDPDSRIAISSDTEETTTRANDTRGGAVTVASNLPDGDREGSGQNLQSSESRSREVVNYEMSETQREVLREPGAIRRISVAVLVDGLHSIGEDGSPLWQPRQDAEIESLRDLVASAIGFDAGRGDALTIKSMEFQSVDEPQQPSPPGLVDRFGLDIMALVQLAVLAIVALILGLFVLRPLMISGRRSAGPAQLPAPDGSDGFPGLPPLDHGLPGPDFEIGDMGSALPALSGGGGEDASARLRRLIDDRKDETVEVLSQWLKDEPEKAS